MVAAPTDHELGAIRPLLRREYDALVERGMLVGEPIELIRGRLVYVVPQGEQHAWVVTRLTRIFARALPDSVDLRPQLPLAALEDSEPEPDLALVPAATSCGPHPTEALLVVEVAVSSARRDRAIKGPLYAEAGVPEFWLVDVQRGVVEVYAEPAPEGYAAMREVGRGESLAPAALPQLLVQVDEFMP